MYKEKSTFLHLTILISINEIIKLTLKILKIKCSVAGKNINIHTNFNNFTNHKKRKTTRLHKSYTLSSTWCFF